MRNTAHVCSKSSYFQRPVFNLSEFWTDWGQWSSCSRTCGRGQETRTRECTSQNPERDCSGEDVEDRSCNAGKCGTYGVPFLNFLNPLSTTTNITINSTTITINSTIITINSTTTTINSTTITTTTSTTNHNAFVILINNHNNNTNNLNNNNNKNYLNVALNEIKRHLSTDIFFSYAFKTNV